MSWEEELFAVLDDLEAEAAGLYDAERALDLADRSRAEYREVTLAARLQASVGSEVLLHLQGPGAVAGRLDRVARDWLVLTGAAQDWVVRTAAVAAVDGASDRAVPEVAWPAVARLGIGSALRRLADARERCVLHRLDGGRHDGPLRRVGADFVEVLEGDPPRVALVALTGVAAVSSR